MIQPAPPPWARRGKKGGCSAAHNVLPRPSCTPEGSAGVVTHPGWISQEQMIQLGGRFGLVIA